MNRNSSAFIQLPGGGHAFVDGLKQDHERNGKGDAEYQTASCSICKESSFSKAYWL